MSTSLPEHSPLGASGSYRWLPPPWGGGCEASVALSQGADDPESEFAAEGTAAHFLAAACLKEGTDAWQKIGMRIFGGSFVQPPGAPVSDPAAVLVTKDMADAVQVYLDYARLEMERIGSNFASFHAEYRFHCPALHPAFYGTADLWYLETVGASIALHIRDYKHGAGVVVEATRNPQLMYYARGVLGGLPDQIRDRITEVVLGIVQPRGWHPDGPIRTWSLPREELEQWAEDVLLPAMRRVSGPGPHPTASGSHCRFCPARRMACPQMMADAKELEGLLMKAKERGAAALTNEEIGRLLTLGEVFKIQHKAARETGFTRAEKGAKVPGWKLAKARSNREWKEGAEKAAKEEFGDRAFTKPALMSPAGVDALPGGVGFTARWAYKPDAGLQIVPEDDLRAEAGPVAKSMFKPVGQERRRRKANA